MSTTSAPISSARWAARVSVEKYGIPSAGAEDDDAALLEVPDRAARDVRLGDLAHRDRGLHPGLDALLLEEVLQRQAVHDRAEHAHVVGAGAVHAALRRARRRGRSCRRRRRSRPGRRCGRRRRSAGRSWRRRRGRRRAVPPPKASPDSLSSDPRRSRRESPASSTAGPRPASVPSLESCHGRGPSVGVGRSLPVRRPAVCQARLRPAPTSKRAKPLHGDAGVVEHGLDGLLAVLHRGLLEQHDVLEEAVDAALDDLGQRRLGLALLAGGRLGDPALGLDGVGRDLVAGDVRRLHRRRPAWPRRGRPRRRRPSNSTSTPTCGGRSDALRCR